MKAQYTPGPWYRDKATGNGIHGAMARYVAQVWHGEQCEANAQLIAAAPELLEALEALIAWVANDPRPPVALDAVRAIVAKAKGER